MFACAHFRRMLTSVGYPNICGGISVCVCGVQHMGFRLYCALPYCVEYIHYTISVQALEVIHELQKHFPIKRSPMRLRLIVPDHEFSSLSEKLTAWNASIISEDQSGSQISTVSRSTLAALFCLVILKYNRG